MKKIKIFFDKKILKYTKYFWLTGLYSQFASIILIINVLMYFLEKAFNYNDVNTFIIHIILIFFGLIIMILIDIIILMIDLYKNRRVIKRGKKWKILYF